MNRIREVREDRGLSGTFIAQKLDISPQYLYDIEKGKRNLSSELAGQLADILAVTTDYLLGKTDLNLYDYVPHPSEKNEKDSADVVAESSKIELDDLESSELYFRGKVLTQDQKETYIRLVRALLDNK